MSFEQEIKNQKAKNKRLQKEGKPQKVYSLMEKDYQKELENGYYGDKYKKCKKCGKEFEQDYVPDRNAYTDFSTCKECRAKRAEQMQDKVKLNENQVYVAKVPFTPYPWQQEAAEAFETHRFQVLSCGNRTGKDRYSIMTGIKYFVECLNENRHIDNPDMVPSVLWWQIAPIEPMARQNWRELKAYFPKDWIVACSDSAYRMETINGGVIEVRSGYDPDSLVGVGLDLVTITEAARFKDLKTAWSNLEARLISEGRGRKKDRGNSRGGAGKAIINSSPLGKNDFYRLYCYGQPDHADYSSDWWSKIYPWTANPTNAEKAKELKQTKYGLQYYEEILRRQQGERKYRSNWLGEFTLEEGSVFKSFEEKCVVNIYDSEMNLDKMGRKEFIENWQKVEPGGNYIGGYDPATGSSGDSPAFVIRNRNNGRVVRVFDLYGKDYEQQWDFIASMCKMYNYAPVAWLRTGHTAVGGQFEKRGIAEIPIDEQGQNKAKLVQTLELAVENGAVQILADGSSEVQTLIYQMNDYTEKNGKYSNNEQAHDDFVSALYAAFSDYSVDKAEIIYCGLMGGV